MENQEKKNDRKNKYDNKDSLKIGDEAENLFACLALQKGYTVKKSSKQWDIHDHWDYVICKDGKSYKIDVKAMKRLNRKDLYLQDEWIWIELHGVRPYDRGWLYDGKADVIAFETRKFFLLVKRDDLIQLVEELVDRKEIVKKPNDAKYKIYRRAKRNDRITLIKTSDLKKISHTIWLKSC